MAKVVKIVAISAVWLLFGALLISLAVRSREYREQLVVRSLTLEIHGDESPLIDGDARFEVNEQSLLNTLKHAKIEIVGKRASSLNISFIESTLEGGGFVERAECYINREGDMTIEVWRRRAALRLMVDNYNCYLTDDGILFEAPKGSPILTHLVTGSYKPLFPSNYRGSIDSYVEDQIEQLDRVIESIEVERYPILKRQRENNDDRSEVQKRFINRRLLESEDEFDVRVMELRESNHKLRTLYADRARNIKSELESIDNRINRERVKQKKLRKKCEDLYNLLIFVEVLNSDPFWRSEVVRIELHEGSNSDMRVELIVRSGSFRVIFGSLDAVSNYSWGSGELNWKEIYDDERLWDDIYSVNQSSRYTFMGNVQMSRRRGVERIRSESREAVESIAHERLERLRNLYDNALVRVGWDRYREINVEFKSQVVCK